MTFQVLESSNPQNLVSEPYVPTGTDAAELNQWLVANGKEPIREDEFDEDVAELFGPV